ncbi:MAG TPA: TonB-dependent receptor plug domain-containing protein, partial [Thermodesulfovibrionales bacterium]|nr:TonB-dependent receptor plug domain-containing protein [Thermodesulfovibrionales bacterium]
MRKIWTFILPLLVVCFPGGGWAEETVKLDEVVVTATKVEELLEETTSSVTVISGEEIRRMNVNFLPDVLRQVNGVSIVQNGGEGKLASVFLRGGDPTATLVLIDGVKVNSPTAGVFDFSSISVDDIERIEVVEGPQSTIYGSEAMAGVINIITKKGEGKPKAAVTVEGGSHGTYKSTATASGSVQTFNYRVTASYFDTEGIPAAKTGTEKDGYKNAFSSWKFGVKPSENSEVEVFGNYYYDRSQLADFDSVTRQVVDSATFVQSGWHFMLSGRAKLYLMDKWEQV